MKIIRHRHGRWLLPVALLLLSMTFVHSPADEFSCADGQAAVADLGDGVIMRTCLWEKQPGVVVRTGPMELIKNDILILKTQTNLAGQLHGLFSSWSDAGRLQQQGRYHEGLKQGQWIFSDGSGPSRVYYYRAGVPLGL